MRLGHRAAPRRGQQTTLRDKLLLARYQRQVSSVFSSFYAQPEFEWNRISQRNRNSLLTKESGVNAFATGFTEKEGYSIVATAEKTGAVFFSP